MAGEPAPSGSPNRWPRFARFGPTSAAAALSFAAATLPLQEPQAGCRCSRDPADGSLWVTTASTAAEELAVALGGTAYAISDGRPISLTAGPPAPEMTAGSLQAVPLAVLAARLLPRGRPSCHFSTVVVVTTGRQAAVIARSWQRESCDVSLAELRLEPLESSLGLDDWDAVLVRVKARNGQLPGQAVAALSELPWTVVCREAGRLMIDIRLSLPVSDPQIAAEVAAGESWVIGAADVGAWRIVELGAEVAPALCPAVVVPAVPAVPSVPQALGGPTPVRVVRAARPDGRVDATLVDDTELAWLKRFLARSPLAETAFLALGEGRHLLTEPSGLLTTVPFGVPLYRIGPGGFYLEAGYVLDPPVPVTARAGLFGLDRESVVVLCHDGACRLALSAMVPAWSLWLGAVPQATFGISAAGRQLLERLCAVGEPMAAPAGLDEVLAGAGGRTDHHQLLEEAERLEQQGMLAQAARRLEEGNEFFRAARLYERAAHEAAEGRG